MRSQYDPSQSKRAITRLELLVVIVIVVILAGMITPPTTGNKAKAQRIKCVNNLKNVGLAYRIFASDHHELFPWQTNGTDAVDQGLWQYISTVTNELPIPRLLSCPADKRPAAESWINFTLQNTSYFLSPDASQRSPASCLAGDRNLARNGVIFPPGRVKIPQTDAAKLSWTPDIHKTQGNVCLSDGSVQQLSSARLRDAWTHQSVTISATTILFP
jgi:type II secretory pathway pseudopilin PulG